MNMHSYDCCKSTNTQTDLVDLSQLLKLVGDLSRLKILCMLRDGSHCVCEIEENLELSQSLISHHLVDLKKAQLIESEKKGKFVHYSLTKLGEQVTQTIFSLKKKVKENEN